MTHLRFDYLKYISVSFYAFSKLKLFSSQVLKDSFMLLLCKSVQAFNRKDMKNEKKAGKAAFFTSKCCFKGKKQS